MGAYLLPTALMSSGVRDNRFDQQLEYDSAIRVKLPKMWILKRDGDHFNLRIAPWNPAITPPPPPPPPPFVHASIGQKQGGGLYAGS